jgi:hypothetical protein
MGIGVFFGGRGLIRRRLMMMDARMYAGIVIADRVYMYIVNVCFLEIVTSRWV